MDALSPLLDQHQGRARQVDRLGQLTLRHPAAPPLDTCAERPIELTLCVDHARIVAPDTLLCNESRHIRISHM